MASVPQVIRRLQDLGIDVLPRSDLGRLCDLRGSDKGFLNGGGHYYAPFYEKFLEARRYRKNTLVEIGLLSAPLQDDFDRLGYVDMYRSEQGGDYVFYPSLKAWADYLPFSRIIGVDKEHFRIAPQDDRISYLYGNQDDPLAIRRALRQAGVAPDIVIDDASHAWSHQQETFAALFPLLAPGGLYFIEDLNAQQGEVLSKPGYDPTETLFAQGPAAIADSPAFAALGLDPAEACGAIRAIRFGHALARDRNILCVVKHGARGE